MTRDRILTISQRDLDTVLKGFDRWMAGEDFWATAVSEYRKDEMRCAVKMRKVRGVACPNDGESDNNCFNCYPGMETTRAICPILRQKLAQVENVRTEVNRAGIGYGDRMLQITSRQLGVFKLIQGGAEAGESGVWLAIGETMRRNLPVEKKPQEIKPESKSFFGGFIRINKR